MSDTQTVNLTPEHHAIVAKLRYMARQYTNGSLARGGSGSRPHYLDEAADAIEELAQRAAVPVGEVKPVAWMNPENTRDCISTEKKLDMETVNGSPGKSLAAKYTIPLFTTPPATPEGWRMVKSPITEDMHVAAVKVLHRATGVDGLPQRMLDAMLAAAPQPGAK